MPAAYVTAGKVVLAATTAFLFLAPFASSAGWRGAMLALGVGALAVRWRDWAPLGMQGMPRILLGAYAAWSLLAIASVAWSVDRPYTRDELKAEILYPALAFAVFFLAADARRWRVWWTAIVVGAFAIVAVTLLQGALPFMIARSPMDGGPGYLSTHLVLVTPLLFALAWPPPWGRGARMGVLLAALALMIAAAWYTQNRIVWIALGAELVVGIAAWRWIPARAQPLPPALVRFAAVAAAALALAFAASLVERSERLFHSEARVTESLERDLRPRIWTLAAEQWREAPWLGHGFGRDVLAATFSPLTPKRANHPEVRHAHNVFIDAALQLGVVGLVLLLAMLASLAFAYRGLLAQPDLAPLGVMGLALIAGFVAKNFTDDFMHRHNALVFWAANGILLGLARSARPRA